MYSAFGPFTKSNGKSKNLKKQEICNIFVKNDLDKACFQYEIAYKYFKDLTRRTASDRILHYKAFNIAKKSKCDRYQRGPTSLVYK